MSMHDVHYYWGDYGVGVLPRLGCRSGRFPCHRPRASYSIFTTGEKGHVILDRQEQHPTIDDGANVFGYAECWGVL